MESNTLERKQMLFGTGNIPKLERVKVIVSDLSIEVVGLSDLNIDIEVEENGNDVHEIALKKAMTYYNEIKIPTFSIH